MSKGRVTNLDEYHVAVDEAVDEAERPQILVGGKTFYMPAELPLSLAKCLREGDFEGAASGLFGAFADEAIKAGLRYKDFDRIAEDSYGLKAGESKASAGSSRTGGVKSRRTSSITTELTPDV